MKDSDDSDADSDEDSDDDGTPEDDVKDHDALDYSKLSPVDKLFWDEKEFGSNGRWSELPFSPKDFMQDYETRMAEKTLDELQMSPRTSKAVMEVEPILGKVFA